jgi:aminopeptidase YwaD
MKPLIKAFVLFVFLPLLSSAQQQSRSDKRIQAALRTHLTWLSKDNGNDATDLIGTKAYVIKQFQKNGVAPGGDSGTWIQHFIIDKGRMFLPTSGFSVNGKTLKLKEDFFPFSFSANSELHSSVEMALAENGVPWFVELKEILDTGYMHAASSDTLAAILAKAEKSAAKGASALIVYNDSLPQDLVFVPMIHTKLSAIPVIYVSKTAVHKYFSDQSGSLDISLKADLKESMAEGDHLVGFIDNGADSTSVVASSMSEDNNIAALIEISRLLKKSKSRRNYLFVATANAEAIDYFAGHLSGKAAPLRDVVNLDTMLSSGDQNGLNKVKQSLLLLRDH